MKTIAIIVVTLALSCYAQAQQKHESKTPPPSKEPGIEARFTAKVEWIELEGKREAEVIPVGVDPHWLIGINILSVETPVKPFDKKGKIILLIHSPAILFDGDEEAAPGRTYSFKVVGAMRDKRPEFYHIQAQEDKSLKKKQP